MSRCFPFPPPGYVKIGERGGDGGPIEIESTKLQKEIKKAEKERKREKKREKKEKKELLKKQQPGVSDGKISKLDGKKPLQGDGKKTDAVLSDNSSRSGLSEEHGQAIPENTFYLSDDTDSSKKRKRDEQSAPTVERKGTKLKLCFSFKKPSTSSDTAIVREEPTCSTSSLQKPSVVERQQPYQEKSRLAQPQAPLANQEKSRLAQPQTPLAPKGGDAKPIPNRSQVRPPPPLQKASTPAVQNLGSRQSTLSAPVVVPQLKKASASELLHKKGSASEVVPQIVRREPTLSVSGVVRSQSHPGKQTSLAAPPSSQAPVSSRDAVLDTRCLKPPQVRGSDQPSTSASQQEVSAVKHKSDKKDKSERRKDRSERKESKRHRRDSEIEAKYNSLFMDWVAPTMVVSEASTDDQEWLFGSKLESRAVPQRSDAVAANFVLPGCEWPPRTHYLAEAEIHALPFTVPF